MHLLKHADKICTTTEAKTTKGHGPGYLFMLGSHTRGTEIFPWFNMAKDCIHAGRGKSGPWVEGMA